jgi:hypothetical protein
LPGPFKWNLKEKEEVATQQGSCRQRLLLTANVNFHVFKKVQIQQRPHFGGEIGKARGRSRSIPHCSGLDDLMFWP